jgi:hypothetical protein
MRLSRALVAHAYNPSYSGGRDQEDLGSKPISCKLFTRPYLEKKPSQKRAGGVASLSSNTSTTKNYIEFRIYCLKSRW